MGEVYTIGKGRLYFRPTGTGKPFRHLGNVPDFKITPTIEKKDHFSSTGGLQKKDKDIITKISILGSCTLDEPNIQNLNLFALGAGSVSADQGAAAVSDEQQAAVLDQWVKMDFMNVDTVVIGDDPTPSTTYVLDTDYSLDTVTGAFMALSTGAITEGQVVYLDYNYSAVTMNRIDAAQDTVIEGHLYFVADPPVGKIIDVRGYVSITPEGDLSLVGEDWMQFSLAIEFLDKVGVPVDGITYNGLYDLYDRGVVTI